MAVLLADNQKSQIVTLLSKSERPFRSLLAEAGYKHTQSLSRALRRLEDPSVRGARLFRSDAGLLLARGEQVLSATMGKLPR